MASSEGLVERRWKSDLLDSEETFHLRELDDGHFLSGRVKIAYGEIPVGLTYRVETRSDWTTRRAEILIPEADVAVNVVVDESGSWIINGRDRKDLEGCIDIDLGWTPATNTLPIRRTRAETHHPFTVEAAWLQWPELRLAATNQTYTRLGASKWRYEQGEFTADLETDRHGVVVTYGSDPAIWYTV